LIRRNIKRPGMVQKGGGGNAVRGRKSNDTTTKGVVGNLLLAKGGESAETALHPLLI